MFYRVDLVVGTILAGFLIGLFIGKASVRPEKIASWYYGVVSGLLVIGFGASTFGMLSKPNQISSLTAGIAGVLSNLCFGAVAGVAVRRLPSRDVLEQPLVLATLRMIVAFTFAIAGIGKAFSMSYMTDFFTQSGYSITFLKFIIVVEVLGAVGLLVNWSFIPCLIGLTIDMWGAVVTHVHNGDPLNDSTGAINMLIRLTAIGLLLAFLPAKQGAPSRMSWRIASVGVVMAACLAVAVVGSFAMHRFR